jgi:predicted nucleic acid-binding protein
MILVDTSAWIQFFRGRGRLVTAVDQLLDTGEAALCGPIVTELRRGLRPTERARVLPLLDGCAWVETPEDLWTAAGDLGAALSRRGITVKTLDLLIATHAIASRTALLTDDRDFVAIAAEDFGLLLEPAQ